MYVFGPHYTWIEHLLGVETYYSITHMKPFAAASPPLPEKFARLPASAAYPNLWERARTTDSIANTTTARKNGRFTAETYRGQALLLMYIHSRLYPQGSGLPRYH